MKRYYHEIESREHRTRLKALPPSSFQDGTSRNVVAGDDCSSNQLPPVMSEVDGESSRSISKGKSTRRKQRDAILAVLVAARGQWVPLPEITRHAAQYNSRIFELRRLGFRIINRIQEVNGERHSWFRLESSLIPTSPTERESSSTTTGSTSLPLFAEGGTNA